MAQLTQNSNTKPAASSPMLFKVGDSHEITEEPATTTFANYAGPGPKSTKANLATSEIDPRTPGPHDPMLVLSADFANSKITNDYTSNAVSPPRQEQAPNLLSPETMERLVGTSFYRRRSSANSRNNDTSRKASDTANSAPPSSALDSSASQYQRRKSSLDKFPIGSFFSSSRRPSVAAAADYNRFAAKNMRLLQKAFSLGGQGSTSAPLPHEVAYFVKVFSLPIPVKAPPASSGGRRLSLTSAASSLLTAVTKGSSSKKAATANTTASDSAGASDSAASTVYGRQAKPYESALEVPKNVFLKYWDAAIQALDEPLASSNKPSGNESPVENDSVPAGVGFKFTAKEKAAFREHIQTPYMAGFLYAVYKLYERNSFLDTVAESSTFGANEQDKNKEAILSKYGLPSATENTTTTTTSSTETPRGNTRGVFFDVSLLHFLASYYSALSSDIVSLKPSLLSPVEPAALASPPGFDAPSLSPLSDYHPQIRLTPTSRCFNFDGIVSTYGAVEESRPQTIGQSYESGLAPLVPVIPFGGPFDEGKDGAANEAYVTVEGALRNSKDLWKYL